MDKKIEKAFLEMASKSKAVEKLLVDYNPNNKKVIDKYKKNKKGGSKWDSTQYGILLPLAFIKAVNLTAWKIRARLK